MTKKSSKDIFTLYFDVLKKCSINLLELSDEMIGYYIFEDLDISMRAFLYRDTLIRLKDERMIDEEIFEKSILLRTLFVNLQETELWNIEAVKQSPEWRNVMELSDEIRYLLISKRDNLDIYYPKCLI